eukprot:TRINITY_DN11629_c0_g1_i1.p1 TRINITY_DN11629_c0_g1~~TRINITY_DN11629_c0_g1_i1.p1  ORF type:complete len:350 (-),score=98.78 TRINITY_DN11629_c0_g1_i1:41-1090(-)
MNRAFLIVSRSSNNTHDRTTPYRQLRQYQSQSPAQYKPRILITGASGQIGTELGAILRQRFGKENVILSDVKKNLDDKHAGPFRYVDVIDKPSIETVVSEENIDTLIHLSSVLSANGEKNVPFAIDLNIRGIENVLNAAVKFDLKVFAPSSIAAFGPTTPLEMTPDMTVMRPQTIYGVSKVYVELLGEYYHKRFGVDFRSLRYPGVISYKAPPGGGTTDYAIDIFYHAIQGKKYTCFLDKDVKLPMMYMEDCLKASADLLFADSADLKQRTYNVTAVSFTPEEIAAEIKKHYPDFEIEYAPDFRNDIALSWPRALDDSRARNDWNWKHEYGLEEMTSDMIKNLKIKLGY